MKLFTIIREYFTLRKRMMILENRINDCESRLTTHTREIWNTTRLAEESREDITKMRDGLYTDTGKNY